MARSNPSEGRETITCGDVEGVAELRSGERDEVGDKGTWKDLGSKKAREIC